MAYVLGLGVAFAANSITKLGQPALLYLVPLTLGSVAITAATRGELSRVLKFTDSASTAPPFGGKKKGEKETKGKNKGKKEAGEGDSAEPTALQAAGKHLTLDLGNEHDRALACLMADHELQVWLHLPCTEP